MNEWWKKEKNSLNIFFILYGKLVVCFFLVTTLCSSLFVFGRLLAPKKLQVSFLDVGQGDAILIQTPSGHDMLIDGGPNNKVLEILSKKMGYLDHHLDVVVSTHPDADHVTGLIPVLEKFDVDKIVVSPISGHTGVFSVWEDRVKKEAAVLHVAKKGDEIIFGDGVVVRILYPRSNFLGNEKDTNDASVSMVIVYGKESVVLTGDLPTVREHELLGESLPRQVTIYKAGHHGSKYSSGDQLLSYLQPSYAVVSAGRDNKYGHPNVETISRLQKYAKEILSTAERGTILFDLDGNNVSVSTMR